MLRKSLALPFVFTLATFGSILPVPQTALAAALPGDSLNIGPMNTADSNTVDANSHSAAIGEMNDLSGAARSAAIGYENTPVNSDASLLAGYWNMADGFALAAFGMANYVYDSANLASGTYNTVHGSANLVAGNMNYLGSSGSILFSDSTALFGWGNQGNNLAACLVAGTLNELDTATDSAAIGHGLILGPGTQSQVVVGQYNAPDVGARFIVATGTNANNPSNAFTVFANGDVIIKKRQGDILMGEFGN